MPIKIPNIPTVSPLAKKDLYIFIESFKSKVSNYKLGKHYVVIHEWDSRDNEYIAELEKLPGCNIVVETEVVPPEILHLTDNGWIRQQLSKLFFGNFIQTEYFLPIDSDTFFSREVRLSDFFDGSRLKVQCWTNKLLGKSEAEINACTLNYLRANFCAPNIEVFKESHADYNEHLALFNTFTSGAETFLGRSVSVKKQFVLAGMVVSTKMIQDFFDHLSNIHGSLQNTFGLLSEVKFSEWSVFGNYIYDNQDQYDITIVKPYNFVITSEDHLACKKTYFIDYYLYPLITLQSLYFDSVAFKHYMNALKLKRNNVRVAGMMIVKDEIDVIEQYLAYVSRHVDSLYVLDASTDGTENILQGHPLVKKYIREEKLPVEVNGAAVFKNGRITDQIRYFLYEAIKKQEPNIEWVTLNHPDEFLLDDLSESFAAAERGGYEQILSDTVYFHFPQRDQKSEWEESMPLFKKLPNYQEVDYSTFPFGQPLAIKFNSTIKKIT